MKERIRVPIADIQEIERQRSDMGDVVALAESIKRIGLIQPIVVNQDLRLIAGGRRLAAHRHLGLSEIDVVFRETLSEDELLELELAENIERHPISWQEHALAIYRIHNIKVRQAHLSSGSWGHRESAQLFGLSKTSVTNTLLLGRELVNKNPFVVKASCASDAIKELVTERTSAARREAWNRYEATLAAKRAKTTPSLSAVPSSSPHADPLGLAQPLPFTSAPPVDETSSAPVLIPLSSSFQNQDCLSWLTTNSGFDVIITDPPYAIDIDMLDQAAGGIQNIDSIRETHKVPENLDLLSRFVPLAYASLKPNGFLAMWCDIMRWDFLYNLCVSAGFSVQRWPVVWNKTSSCLNMSANKNFTKNVEFCIVARKGLATLAKPSPTCVITASNVDKLSDHPFSKPPAVWDFLIRHLCIANSRIADPFMGVGSCPFVALDLGHDVSGCEIDPKHYAAFIDNAQRWFKGRYEKVEFV